MRSRRNVSTRPYTVQTRAASRSQPIHNRKDRIRNSRPVILDSETIGRSSREGEHPDLATQSQRDHEQTRHLCLQNPTGPRRCGSDEEARLLTTASVRWKQVRRKHLRKDHPRPCRPWRTARIPTQQQTSGYYGLSSPNGQRRYAIGNGSRSLARKLRRTCNKGREHHRDTHKI